MAVYTKHRNYVKKRYVTTFPEQKQVTFNLLYEGQTLERVIHVSLSDVKISLPMNML
jgi:hypothetical protein